MKGKSLRYGLVVSTGLLLLTTHAAATECLTEYSWKCGDKSPNTCKGSFAGDQGCDVEAFNESNACPEEGQPEPVHELWYVLRFSGLPKGAHSVRTTWAAQGMCTGGEESETMDLKLRAVNGCEENGMFATFAILDEPYSEVTDFPTSESGTTDLCIAFESNEQASIRNEFLMGHASCHPHPVMVTTLDTNYTADSATLGKGSVVSGGYASTRTSDDNYHVLKEGGTQHQLRYVYAITQIPPGSSQTLYVEGSRLANVDGDNFDIRYKWVANGTACNPTGPSLASGIIIDSETETVESASVGNSSGTLCVQVADTAGGGHDNEVYIDNIYVVTANPSCP